jgi:FkbM family methyltransferase
MINNLTKLIIDNGGSIIPLLVPSELTQGLGLCNATVHSDGEKVYANIRNVHYTLHHNERNRKFQSIWSGPLQYLNPEDDLTLTSSNFLCELNPDTLEIEKSAKVDTSKLDVKPLWEFVGLEDARLVNWDNNLYMCGVRRDTTTNGEGRMEMSKVVDNKEVTRNRIEVPPTPEYLYCEKNWMPVDDMPYHFIKWGNPTELVKVDLETNTSEFVMVKELSNVASGNLRGGSQVITLGEYRIALIHEVFFPGNPQGHKDAVYTHKFVVWDKEWNILHTSQDFNFMTALIEFSCGMTIHNGEILVTFGFQDNAAYLIRIPMDFFKKLVKIDTAFNDFDWGVISESQWFLDKLEEEIILQDVYQKFFKVEKGDLVVDIGASAGPFTKSILKNKPKKVFCLEPSKSLYKTLTSNLNSSPNVTCINKGVINVDGEAAFSGLYDPNGYNTGGNPTLADGIKFSTFVKDNNIKTIDFLKVDCEGGEYDIFNIENKEWIFSNVRKISGEFHLNTQLFKDKFRAFRDNYLAKFKNFEVYSADGIDIKWDLFNAHFIEYYEGITIYINNEVIGEDKLNGFPTVNWVSLKDSVDRQKMMLDQLNKLGINKHKMVEAYDGRIVNYKDHPIVEVKDFDDINSMQIAALISHLTGIKDWYENTDEEIGFFCEDDVLLTNSENWNFTWKELVARFPKNWKAVQLSLVRDDVITEDVIKFKTREFWDYGACGYALNREYAGELLKKHIINGKFVLKVDYPGGENILPFIENIIYTHNDPNIYRIPAFVEDTSVGTTFYPYFSDSEHKDTQIDSANSVLDWWIRTKDEDQLSILFKPRKDYWKATPYPTLEFTTSIPVKGCVVDCAFCPQRTLVNIYDGDRVMSFDSFKKIVDKLPKEIRVTFSGFVEPWLNKRCTDMLIYAHEQGHPVSLFTTGIGMTVEDVDRLKNIPFAEGPNGGFCLHLPDQERIAKHPMSKKYMKVLERIKEVQNEIQGFYLMSMGEVLDDVKHLFPTAHTPEMWSRAGNLLGEAILKPELDKIKDRFKHMDHGNKKKTCGCAEDLYHNVVLPNGDVSLCCMDYGLKEIIGNLYTDDYDDILPKPNTCFTLCQKCENGIDAK